MEHSLSHVVREFEYEREIIGSLAKKELQEVRDVAAKLKQRLEKKTVEMQHIRVILQITIILETGSAYFRSKNRYGTIFYGRIR